MCRKIIVRLVAAAGIGCAVLGNGAANGAEISAHEVGLVPKPVRMEMSAGSFRVLPGCRILFDNEYAEKATAEYLAEILHKVVAGPFPVQEAGAVLPNNCIFLTIQETYLGKEGYTLNISTNAIVIRAFHPAGLFYGVQTFRQLL